MENDRSWIRQVNTKLYDAKIKKLINDSSNGADLLKNEIKNSDNRLRSVKSGISLAKVVQKPGAGYYVPDIESYFKGVDKIMRRRELKQELTEDEEKSVKFFLTETVQQKRAPYQAAQTQ